MVPVGVAITVGLEVAKLVLPFVQQMLNTGMDSGGNPLTPAQIKALRASNDELTRITLDELEATKRAEGGA